VLLCAALAGCQTRPAVPTDVMKAACVAQAYLRVNGFFDAPTEPIKVTMTTADARIYTENGHIDYERMLTDRHGTYAGKLRGARAEPDGGYRFFYQPARREPRCLAVDAAASFAWFPVNDCQNEAPDLDLRERNLRCPP
jgi:hypothetical protein